MVDYDEAAVKQREGEVPAPGRPRLARHLGHEQRVSGPPRCSAGTHYSTKCRLNGGFILPEKPGAGWLKVPPVVPLSSAVPHFIQGFLLGFRPSRNLLWAAFRHAGNINTRGTAVQGGVSV